MLQNILIGCSLLIFTSLLHLLLTYVAAKHVSRGLNKGVVHRLLSIELIVLTIFFFTVLEAIAWATCFVWRGALAGMEEAVYFSLVTYTTLGYGDVVLPADARLLGALEAANGAIIFGWSTALVVQSLQRLYRKNPS